MRISEVDLQCDDLVWFGIDKNGHVFECTSAGCGNVPEYVCRSKEETEQLLRYFTEDAPVITNPILLIPESDNELLSEIKSFSSKGIYCFDITDYDNDEEYSCIAKPTNPLLFSSLPEHIQKIMSDHNYSGDVSAESSISVEHAYK